MKRNAAASSKTRLATTPCPRCGLERPPFPIGRRSPAALAGHSRRLLQSGIFRIFFFRETMYSAYFVDAHFENLPHLVSRPPLMAHAASAAAAAPEAEPGGPAPPSADAAAEREAELMKRRVFVGNLDRSVCFFFFRFAAIEF